MASILQPLQTQLPAQALAQSASALEAYEQLRGIRDKRQQEAQAQQQKALIAQLTGRTMMGDNQAAQQLAVIAPDALMGVQKHQMDALKGRADLQSTQTQTQLRQAELPQVQQKSADVQRTEALRRTQVLKSAVQRIRENPDSYAAVASQLVNRGLVPPGALPDTVPTEDQLNSFEAQVNFTQELQQNPAAQEKLSGMAATIAAAYGGADTKDAKEALDAYVKANIDVMQARSESLRRPRSPLIQFGGTTTGTRAHLERDIANKEMILSSIDALDELDPLIDSIATFQGRGKTSIARMLDKVGFLGPDDPLAKHLTAARQFTTRIGEIFQPIKLVFTGAAAPEKEMDKLEATIINSDLGPVELRAAKAEIRRMATDAIRIQQRIIERGVMPGTEEFARQANMEWSATRGRNDAVERILNASGRNTAPVPGQPVQSALPSNEPASQAPQGASPTSAPPSPLAQPEAFPQGQGPLLPPEQAAGPASPPRPPTAAESARGARQDINAFNRRLRELRKQGAQKNAAPRQAPAPLPPGRRGGATGQRSEIGRLSDIPNQSFTPEQAAQIEQTFQAFGGGRDARGALERMVRDGYITQDFADAVLQATQ